MKSTGIVRKVDELGRVVIPIELRRTLGIAECDPLEIYTDDNGGIILKKFNKAGVCIICGSDADVREVNKKYICVDCCTIALQPAQNVEMRWKDGGKKKL